MAEGCLSPSFLGRAHRTSPRAKLARGDDAVGNPQTSSNLSIRVFRAYPLIELRQTILHRAIRGNGISVSPPPPLASGVATAALVCSLTANRVMLRLTHVSV